MRCRAGGCSPGDVLLCFTCDVDLHGVNVIHPRDKFDDNTQGYTPLPSAPRIFTPASCTICKQSVIRPETHTLTSSKTVLLQTLTAGEVQVEVRTISCSNCNSEVGSSAAEYRCVQGGSNQWLTQELVDNQSNIYKSSRFRLPTVALGAASEMSHRERGGTSVGSRARAAAGGRAFRLVNVRVCSEYWLNFVH